MLIWITNLVIELHPYFVSSPKTSFGLNKKKADLATGPRHCKIVLELNAQSELHLPRIASRVDHAKLAWVADVSGSPCAAAARQVEVGMVKGIEGIRAELNVYPFSHGEMFGQPYVKVGEVRAAQVVASTTFKSQGPTECAQRFGRISEKLYSS